MILYSLHLHVCNYIVMFVFPINKLVSLSYVSFTHHTVPNETLRNNLVCVSNTSKPSPNILKLEIRMSVSMTIYIYWSHDDTYLKLG